MRGFGPKGIPGRRYSMKKGMEVGLRAMAGEPGGDGPGLRRGALCYSPGSL